MASGKDPSAEKFHVLLAWIHLLNLLGKIHSELKVYEGKNSAFEFGGGRRVTHEKGGSEERDPNNLLLGFFFPKLTLW